MIEHIHAPAHDDDHTHAPAWDEPSRNSDGLAFEEWRDIPGHEGRYRVSSLGRVSGVQTPFLRANSIAGYQLVKLYVGGRRSINRSVHSLAALAFIGPRPEAAHIDHIDNDRSNNAISNLRYATRQQNMDHMVAQGRQCRGANHARARFTDDDVLEIRRAYRPKTPGLNMNALAKKYGCDRAVIRHIVVGNTWKHLPIYAEGRAVADMVETDSE